MSKDTRAWFQFAKAQADSTSIDIHIIDIIGGWYDDLANRYWNEEVTLTARAFVEQLAAIPDSVRNLRVHINSPGGDVQAGVNIANALREQVSKGRTVETFVDGIAASIASVIAMAGSKVHMADNALMMIHNPWGIEIGDAAAFRKYADTLDTMRGQIVNTYRWHSTLEASEIEALMDAETWMNADEAIERGFATEKVEGLKAAALLPKAAVARLKVPAAYRARVDAHVQPEKPKPAAASAIEVIRACNEGGCPEVAEELVASGATVDQVQAKVTSVKAARQLATQRTEQITAACAAAKLPELAQGYVAGGMTLDQVRAQLAVLQPRLDKAEIDGGLLPDHGGKPKARINTAAVYARVNNLVN